MSSNTVNLCLEEIERLKRERDRAVVQRAGMEGELWFAECQMKQIVTLLPRLIAATPADGVARDTYVDQLTEWLAEPRHHPTDTALPDAAAGHNGSTQGDIGKSGTTLADEVAAGLHDEPSP